MDDQIRFDEDWHVSSTFSNGTATVEENVHAAEARELRSLCVVDRVRASTFWVRDLVDACKTVDRETAVQVNSGVEAEVLDTNGTLDLPRSAERADFLFVAARRLPTPTGPMHPQEAREQIEAGKLLPARAVEWLVRASANAACRENAVVLAHPFSILPLLGIDPCNVHPAYVRWLAGALVDKGACVEISERWRSPGPSVVGCFLTAGVTVCASSGSDSPESVGQYDWCRGVAAEFAGRASRPDYSEPLTSASFACLA